MNPAPRYTDFPQYTYPMQYGYPPQYPYAPQPAEWNEPEPNWDAPDYDWDTFAIDALAALPAKPDIPAPKAFRIVTNILFYALVLAIVGGSALFALSKDPQKSYFGYRLYTVKTPSMTPQAGGGSPPGGFRAGDAIVVKLVSPETIQVGDIVTYIPGKDPNVYLTHRVVKILDHLHEDKGLFFVTRGDANDADDPPIRGNAVVGVKVLNIPGTGAVLQFIRDNFILSLVVIISSIGFVILLRMYLGTGVRKRTV